jgi:hypothetical protein
MQKRIALTGAPPIEEIAKENSLLQFRSGVTYVYINRTSDIRYGKNGLIEFDCVFEHENVRGSVIFNMTHGLGHFRSH